jgi:MFS family permease
VTDKTLGVGAPARSWIGPRAARYLYGAVALLYWASLYAYVPTLPAYAATLTTDLALIGTILSMYGLWQAIVRLPVGIASDWIGWRKPFIVLGLLMCAAGALLMRSAATPQTLLYGRAITGLGAATWVPLTVVFSALYPPEQAVRATTVLTLMSAIARLFATGANAPLNALGGYGLAFTGGAALAVAAIALVLPAPEQRRPVAAPTAHGLLRLGTRKDVVLPAALSAVAHFVLMGISYGFITLRAKELGASSAVLSNLTVIHLAGFTPSVLLAAVLVKRYPLRPLLVASFVVIAAGTLCAAGPSVGWLVASQLLVAVGYGVSYPILMGMSIERVDGRERTTAMGLHQSIYAIGMFAGPWMCGIMAAAIGMQAMFAVTAIGALVLGVSGTLVATRPARVSS